MDICNLIDLDNSVTRKPLTPLTGPAPKVASSQAPTPPPRPQLDAAVAAASKKLVDVSEENAAVPEPTRREVVNALPTLQSVTGAEPVDNYTTLHLVADPFGVAGAAAFDETSTSAKVAACLETAWNAVESLVKSAHTSETIGMDAIAPRGYASLAAERGKGTKSGKNGVLRWTVLESAAEYAIETVTGAFTVAAPFDDTAEGWWEVVVPEDAFSGSVIHQIKVQLGVSAIAMYDPGERGFTCYRFVVASASQEAQLLKKQGVTLGKCGLFKL